MGYRTSGNQLVLQNADGDAPEVELRVLPGASIIPDEEKGDAAARTLRWCLINAESL